MRVVVVHEPDCPHAATAASRTAVALGRIGRGDVRVDRAVVGTAEDANRLGVAGSPTILVDGRDLFPRVAASRGTLSCRLYPTPVGPAGSPTVEQLVDALSAACSAA